MRETPGSAQRAPYVACLVVATTRLKTGQGPRLNCCPNPSPLIPTSIPTQPHIYPHSAPHLFPPSPTSIPTQPHIYPHSAPTSIPTQPHIYPHSKSDSSNLEIKYLKTRHKIYSLDQNPNRLIWNIWPNPQISGGTLRGEGWGRGWGEFIVALNLLINIIGGILLGENH